MSGASGSLVPTLTQGAKAKLTVGKLLNKDSANLSPHTLQGGGEDSWRSNRSPQPHPSQQTNFDPGSKRFLVAAGQQPEAQLMSVNLKCKLCAFWCDYYSLSLSSSSVKWDDDSCPAKILSGMKAK